MAGEEPVAALMARSPKEQAELNRFGTINGMPVAAEPAFSNTLLGRG